MHFLKASSVHDTFKSSSSFLIACCFILASASSCFSEQQEKLLGKARFATEYFNFGVVAEGQTVSHSFDFENVGNAELKVVRTVSTCGCTVASSSNESIAPGAKAAIKVEFNSSGFSGKLKKVIRVYTNEIENSERLLTLEGEVQSPYQLLPSRIYFDNVLSGAENESQDFSLQIRKDSAKVFKTIKSFSPYLSVKQLADNSDSQYLTHNFRVTLDNKAPLGDLRDRILLEISDGRQSSFINLPVLARISGPLSLDPRQVSFGMIQGTALLERKVRILNTGRESIELHNIKADHKAISTKIETIVPGKEFLLSVLLDPQKVGSDLRALVEIETSSEAFPSLLLSVFGVVPPLRD